MQAAQTINQYEGFITKYESMDNETIKNRRKHTDRLKISKIQRTCVHDGPGIRTVLFFAGCNLRCLWCQNPELIAFQLDNTHGSNDSVDDIIQTVMKDKAYYISSNGGVTLSGGEPLLQHTDSLVHLLKLLKKENIHVAVETSGHVPWKNIKDIAPYIDLFLIDLKIVNNDPLHMKYTKQDSQLIHSNITKLVALNANIQFRMVVVPGFNDNDSNIKDAADFLKSIHHHSIQLLKYHNMYEAKSKRLGVSKRSLDITNDQSVVAVRRVVDLFQSFDINATCELDFITQKSFFPNRIHTIQKDIRESEKYLCLESATLKTRFYKKNGFDQPTHIHRAERLAYLLNHKKVTIYPDELVVGNFTSKRVAGNVWEEYFGIIFISIIHQIHRQKPVPFKCSFEDKVNFYTNIFPFWAKRSLLSYKNKTITDWMLLLARCSDMKLGFNNNQAGIAHFIVNHDRILELGTTGIIKDIQENQKANPDNNHDFYNAAMITLKGLEDYAERYANRLMEMRKKERDPDRRQELEKMATVCKHVPKYPARTFHEALQSILFLQIALCTESFENAISFGRLDQILYPYFKKDKEANLITYEEAKELLACFILKIDEVILVNDGDTYLGVGRLFESLSTVQSVTFGGVDKNGDDATNDVTYMLLDICELQPRGVNMTARIHNASPSEYLERIAEVYINGSPMPALYNDEIYVEALNKQYPTTIQDARNYSIVGCVEPVASDDHFANTDCANVNVVLPFLQALKGEDTDLWNFGLSDQLSKLSNKFIRTIFSGVIDGVSKHTKPLMSLYKRVSQTINNTLPLSSDYNSPKSMDELIERYQLRLNQLTASILADHQLLEDALQKHFTTPLASSLFKGCVTNGKDVYEGGATLNSSGIQAVGITDVADSLFAIDVVVFQKKLYTIDDIIRAIDNNFEGEFNQEVREALQKVPKFGDDSAPEAQKWVNKVLEIYVNALNSVPSCPRNGIYSAGYYALNVNIVYGENTPALPSGRLKGIPLAHSIAPHYGMQSIDLVSSLNSVAGVDFVNYAPNGTTITFTIDSALFQGEAGVKNLAGIISAFFRKGGMQFQPNVINREVLIDAYNHPEKHPYLLIRIAGYCAYFNDLSDELKLAIINRTCYS
ncbi:MAG: radical SAM protein [Candidatus Magnetomorum sp.]|nr:radical SAM protein [Candidatus Magnetomorum sp.]